MNDSSSASPVAAGLYDPRFEHDACGVGMVVQLDGDASHEIVDQALTILENLAHRGASGAEPSTGDGAGIMVQIPDTFLRSELGGSLPAAGHYGTGLVFLAKDPTVATKTRARFEELAAEEGLQVLSWRSVPVVADDLGDTARRAEPLIEQVIVASVDAASRLEGITLDRQLYPLRKRAEHSLEDFYMPSLSSRTLVYKGMLTSHQLRTYFSDLSDARFESAIGLVHSRFSTNTFPSWQLAHPYRLIAHNGEINTVQGNRNWMRAREALLSSPLISDDLERLFPICTPGASDSASFDEVLELLHLGGRSLPHAVLMMIPEAWENQKEMDPARRDFYSYHACLMEPWDGPANVAFTDGSVIGAVLDRNGLRPARYWTTRDRRVIFASEVGVLDVDPADVLEKGRLEPGRMFLVDTEQGRIVDDTEIKTSLAAEHPYGEWLEQYLLTLDDLPDRRMLTPQHASVVTHQRLFGYTNEELRLIVAPMAKTGAEPIGSMGSDTPPAVLSTRPRLLFDYFTQLFAQVTNPPLDAIREELVTSVSGSVGPERNVLDPRPESCHQIRLSRPIIDRDDLAKLLYVNEHGETPGFKAFAVDGLFRLPEDPTMAGQSLQEALDAICHEISEQIALGANVVILSDRNSTDKLLPIPSLLLTAAVHQHLVREKARTKVGLVVEAGDAREVHHVSLLIGFGAAAVNPYLALDSIDDMIASGLLEGVSPRQARLNFIKAASKGVLKVMSKMGVSTVASYTGAQIFEAIGLDHEVIGRCFTGTVSRLGGVGLDVIASEVIARHHEANLERPTERAHRELEVGGEYQWRREGEIHLFNPKTVFKLQHATRSKRYDVFKEYSSLVDEQSERLATLRGLLRFKHESVTAISLDEVEPISAIVRRFSTGAMSYGSISAEAHETLAIAMNRLGAKSNTGEGGEDVDRFSPDANGDSRRSAIKQVASGRFGVTSNYLVNADDLQIKIAQGAKPGEGGQLPGHKVSPWIAKTRHSTPGVGLISPPPHHDIYSIEDIAQLIHDLKSANPEARVHVKLVSQVGVGTVAAGVAKAHSDVVLISGSDGGTGAAPLTSLKHAGAPWELGLAETQQTLIMNGLRDRIVVQVDGQMKTGRDVVVAALLGAEEFGFATAPLVVSGCVMMRVCHLDTCPVGIATQNPTLRSRYSGKPEFVETFFEYVADEVREILASLGLQSLDDAIGRTDLLDAAGAIAHWKAQGLDLSPILAAPSSLDGAATKQQILQDHGLDKALDQQIIPLLRGVFEEGKSLHHELVITNRDRTVGTLIGYELTKRFGEAGLPDGSISLLFRGSAGQSFGAFLPAGITMRLLGDANDYLGKGLSGGRIIVTPHPSAPFESHQHIIAGNVILYGATAGEVFLRGKVGERFCVRNSGATAVVEGVGDHGCEYMTGGRVVVLGPTGRNFGAGMSGGIAYVADQEHRLANNLNDELVDLEPLGPEDEQWLFELLVRYADETDSQLARALLDQKEPLKDFVKVMPRDYRRVLEAIDHAQKEGHDVDEAIMALSHG
jgi:glutamate synthase (NADPH/NADH) large chain